MRVLTNFAGLRQLAEYVVMGAQLSAATLACPCWTDRCLVAWSSTQNAPRSGSRSTRAVATSFPHYRYVNVMAALRGATHDHFSSSLRRRHQMDLANYRDVVHIGAVSLATGDHLADQRLL
jgi:hypothetical protein